MSSGNRVSLKYIEESDYGVAPTDETGATPGDVDAWNMIRYTTESLSGTPTTVTSGEVRADRQVSDQFKTALEVTGNVAGEFSFSTYDNWLEGSLAGTWDNGVLKAGSALKSYSIEKEYGDVGSDGRFVLFNGMRVNTFTLGLKYGEIITASFDFAGSGVSASSVSAVLEDGADGDDLGQRLIPSPANIPLNASTNVLENALRFGLTNTAFSSTLNSIQLTVNNNLRAQSGIGYDSPLDQLLGTSQISGSFEIYLDSDSFDLYRVNVLNQSKIDIRFTIQESAGMSYAFVMPNVKITAPAPAGGGLDTDTVLSGEFNALYDPTLQTALQITRTG